MASLFRTIVSLPTSYGPSTLLWKWNFILSLCNLQGFLRNIVVFTLQVFPFATLEKIETKMVFGAKLQNNEQSSLTLFWWCLSTKALPGSIQPAWAPQKSTHYFAHWGGSVNVGWRLPLTAWVTEAGGCLSWCLSVCLKVLLPGAGWLNVWTTVNRWIALLFWSTVSSFSFCYQVSEPLAKGLYEIGSHENLSLVVFLWLSSVYLFHALCKHWPLQD